MTVEFLVNGTQASKQNITISDGETVNLSFSHRFRTSGQRNVTIAATVTFTGPLNNTHSAAGNATTTVRVGKQAGTALPVPKELEDEVNDVRDSAVGSSGNAFVLATPSEVFLVFTETEPRFGTASVSGAVLQTTVSHRNTTLGVIAASSVSVETTPTEVHLSEVSSAPKEHELSHVAINATHRRVGLLADPDTGNNVSFPVTAGVLTTNTSTGGLAARPGARLRNLSQNLTARAGPTAIRQNITRQLRSDYDTDNRLPTVGFRHAHWARGPARVEGIVLTPGSAAYRYVASLDRTNATAVSADTPVLYTLARTQSATRYANVTAVRTEASDGSYVRLSANVSGVQLSTQETIENMTGCTDRVLVQTPSGPVCADLPVDVSIHAKMAYNGIPSSSDDLLPVIGLATTHNDTLVTSDWGRYELSGRVVSTTQIDSSLPDADVLVVYSADQTETYTLEGRIERLVDNELSMINQTLAAQLRNESTTALNLTGDINGDGQVGLQDAILIGRGWRCSTSNSCYSQAADLNGDGIIDIFDAVIVARNFGTAV